MRSGARVTGARATGTGTGTGARAPGTGTGARAEVFRLTPPLVFWWIWLAFVLVNVIDFAVQPAQARFVTVVSAILAAGTGLAFALALRPRVLAGHAGITVLNPFRTHRLPWSAVRSVDVGQWVRVHYAADKTIVCWALPAAARDLRPGGRPALISRIRRPASRGFGGALASSGAASSGAQAAAGVSRLPEEARRLMSLSPAQASATRLDSLARKARVSANEVPEARGSAGSATVTSRWSWPAIAAVVIPAAALLIVLAA